MRETASARRQAPRHVASILDAARKLGIRDAQDRQAVADARIERPFVVPRAGRAGCAVEQLVLPQRVARRRRCAPARRERERQARGAHRAAHVDPDPHPTIATSGSLMRVTKLNSGDPWG